MNELRKRKRSFTPLSTSLRGAIEVTREGKEQLVKVDTNYWCQKSSIESYLPQHEKVAPWWKEEGREKTIVGLFYAKQSVI